VSNDWKKQIRYWLLESAKVNRAISDSCSDAILTVAEITANHFKAGGKLMLCGNGGSAADCQHIAAEFVGRLSAVFERPALPAIALTTDTSCLTAVGNDYGFEHIFERQVEALGKEGDVLIAISTSGNSESVIRAITEARERGIRTIGFLGGDGGKVKPLVDIAIVVPSKSVPRIQEAHITMGHIICELVEQMLYRGKGGAGS
jgi:D-sedoheptulose 7-phosphate isomerase